MLILFITLIAIFIHPPVLNNQSANYMVNVDELVSVKINGYSNINKFSLEYREPVSSKKVLFGKSSENRTTIHGDNKISLEVNSFTCNQKIILRDFKKMVKSETSPTIDIQFLRFTNGERNNIKSVTATVNIGGTKRYENFQVKIDRINPSTYFFSTTHRLSLKNYNLEAPQKMLGAIVVNDEVTIDINFTAKIREI